MKLFSFLLITSAIAACLAQTIELVTHLMAQFFRRAQTNVSIPWLSVSMLELH
ncbi:hypothetical protein SCLCIDRAFT_1224078 [Scleroderma citrinum Foug A]|uniref:Uncharacterized protein n=1 Tax=Scleroderma citrinum Foug A TaxID=1036808 RepID=A0A0C3D7L3_9AGAM|nr:hypothetical protein SCLCIDRAFT_1224078 [Scleroderma citrinum Foug A]